MKYKHIALGGTFDRLHNGHKAFLKEAFHMADKVSLGLSEDSFITSKKLANQILPYSKRKQELETFLQSENYLDRATLFSLHDIYGIAGDDPTVDAVLVTPATHQNAQKINEKRIENGLPPLEICEVKLVLAEDNDPIQSEKIREGLINRNGFSFVSLFKNKTLHLPESLREELRKPLGEIVLENDKKENQATLEVIDIIKKEHSPLVVAVGDIIASNLRSNNFPADIEVLDYKTRRTQLTIQQDSIASVLNEHGTINTAAVERLQNAIKEFLKTKKHEQIVISGEEDLLALPAILLSPLGSIVLYGQWDLGIVVIKVTEEIKSTTQKIINQFT